MITHTEDLSKKLEAFLDETWALNDLPGLAVGIYCGASEITGAGDFVFTGVRGYSDYEKRVPMGKDDIFHCASVSKLFTSTAIMKLVEAGVLSLHDKLTKLLPDFEMADERFRDIELLHMLTHTSGLGDCADYHWDRPRCDEAALHDYVYSDEVTQQPMVWEPGTGFRYSNVAYEILGYIASVFSEKMSGQDVQRLAGETSCYEDLVQKYCFKPAGMTDSTMKTFERPEGPLVTPHEKRPDRSIGRVEHFPYTRQHAPSSTLTSNVSDLLKWGQTHLAGAAGRKVPDGGQHHRIYDDKGIYETIWKPYAEVPNNGERIGIGWFIRKQRGYTLYGHEGSDDGFRASFWICPELDTVTVVLSNLSNAPVKKINKKLFERIVSI